MAYSLVKPTLNKNEHLYVTNVDTPNHRRTIRLFTLNHKLYDDYTNFFGENRPITSKSSGIDLLVPEDIIINDGQTTVSIDFQVSQKCSDY